VLVGQSNQSPLDRILFDIARMCLVVLKVADAVVAKSPLPNRKMQAQLLAEPTRGTTFDVLHSSLQRHTRGRSNENVKVFGHENEGVKPVGSLVPVMKKGFYENMASRYGSEQGTTLPRTGSYKVSAGDPGSALRDGHTLSG
jgi:hypothetical protein